MNLIIKAARVEKQMMDEAEMALINAQTLVPRTADSLFAFRLCACDNQIDRDTERFTERTLDQLAELFVGRPVLRDHNWSANSQTARVYAAGVEMQEGVKRLILRAYMPRSTRTANTITDIITDNVSDIITDTGSTVNLITRIHHTKSADYQLLGTDAGYDTHAHAPIEAERLEHRLDGLSDHADV